MKKVLTLSLLACIFALYSPAFATNKENKTYKTYVKKAETQYEKISKKTTHGKNGKVTPKSIGAGALSLLIWPGIGQLMNYGNDTEKAAIHALLGFTGIFRIWSCYDGIVDRKGGVWDNRI